MKKISWLVQLLLIALIAFAGSCFLMTEVLSKDTVSGDSMQPTLEDNDRLISLRHQKIAHNEIVVLDAPDRKGGLLYIKRIIGMPGDTVRVENERLYINGKLQSQPYLKTRFMRAEIKAWGKSTGKNITGMHFTDDFDIATNKATMSQKVPQNEYFVMGDNRFVSHDGRAFGFIKASAIRSVVLWRYWPLVRMKIF